MNDRRRSHPALLALAAVLSAAMTLALLALVQDDHRGPSPGSSAPVQTRPGAQDPTNLPPTGPSPACAGANLEGITGSGDDTGSVQAYWRGLVGPVYEAACAGDERPLSNLFLFVESHEDFMTSPCPGCTPGEIITMWLKDFGFGTEDLALLLETPPTQDQSGLTYRRGDAVTWFSRGTHDTPGGWAGLYPACEADRRCREYLAP